MRDGPLGIAHALGPNYNKPWEAFDEADLASSVSTSYAAVLSAREASTGATPVEQALIAALLTRYPSSRPDDDCSFWNDNYAAAMRAVYAEHGHDLDVAALFAEALLVRTPWALWDLETGAPADGADTIEARDIIERALENPAGRFHPGVLHMYLHLMEMSPHPELALRAADWLRGLVPDAGHLEHMPTHIDVLCGHYQNVVASNTNTINADRLFLETEGAMNFYSLYRSHNYHFALYGAMFLGQYATAIAAADEMVATIPAELLRVESPPMADWLEGFVSMRMHVLIRFGKWQEILDTPLADDAEVFCVTTAMIHYARSVAYAVLDRVEEAVEEQALFRAAVSHVPDSRYVFNNTCLDILAIASEMLDGEIEYRRGNFDGAFAHLRRSVELDDGLPYDEPWGWMQPTRHAYGALFSSKVLSRRPRLFIGPILGLTTASHAPTNIGTTSGACTGSTNASNGWVSAPRPRSLRRASLWPWRELMSRSSPRATAGGMNRHLASIHRLLIGGRCLGSILVVGRVGRGVLVRARVGVAVGGSWVGCRRRACRGCVRSWCEVSA